MSLYHEVTMSLYHEVTMSLYHEVTMSLYHAVTMSLYHEVTMSLNFILKTNKKIPRLFRSYVSVITSTIIYCVAITSIMFP